LPSTKRAQRPARAARAARAVQLDGQAIALLERVQQVVCEPNRTRIVRALGAAPLSVSELAHVIGRSNSATSRHLRVLRDLDIVAARRRGRRIYLSLGASPAAQIALSTLDQVTTAAHAPVTG
jgi:DNA-binding transcriptional ArsR family regulator